MNDQNTQLRRKVDLMLHELKELRSSGPHFQIVHRFRMPGSNCLPGEEVAAAYLICLGQAFFLKTTLSERLLLDYLASHLHVPQSAAQIAAGLQADPFYSLHGRNAPTGQLLTRRFSPVSIKTYVKRLRDAMGLAFTEASLSIDPTSILVSQPTTTNRTTYVLKANVAWQHADLALPRRHRS